MTSTRRALPALLVASAAGLALTGCAAPAPADEATGLSVVASTNVYGDVAAAIAGDAATVTSIIDSPTIDPHSYEASAQDQLVISTADLIIENGGGYDPFVDVLVEGSGTEAVVISAVVVGGLLEEGEDAHSHSEEEAHAEEESHADEAHSGDEAHSEDDGHGHLEGTNEHVWYDIHIMEQVAEAIATELAGLDADNAAAYEENLAAWMEELEALEGELESAAETARRRHRREHRARAVLPARRAGLPQARNSASGPDVQGRRLRPLPQQVFAGVAGLQHRYRQQRQTRLDLEGVEGDILPDRAVEGSPKAYSWPGGEANRPSTMTGVSGVGTSGTRKRSWITDCP